jgi:signal peptidase I
VGDLSLDATLDIQKIAGEAPAALLELVEGVRRYRCEFDLKTGAVTLQRTDELKGDGSFTTMAANSAGIQGTGRYAVSFSNVDDRLCLWIDGRLISFGAEADYTPPAIPHPQPADLHPVGLAVKDVSAAVSQLVVYRDIYYRAVKSPRDSDGEGSFHFSVGRECARLLHDPEAYGNMYFREPRSVEFEALDDDEYFAMGDNSTRSYDGRLWHPTRQSHHAHAVNRRALIGKAFFIYWPHGIPFLNHGKGYPVMMHQVADRANVENYPLYTAPFYPQWWRWKRIR